MISIPSPILTAALAGLLKLVKGRSTLPILNCALIHRTGPRVTLTATDLDCALTYTYRSTPEPITALAKALEAMQLTRERETLVVPMDALKTASRGDNDGIVEMEATGLRYFVQGAPISIPYAMAEPSEFPESRVVSQPLQPLSESARQAICDAMLCASDDPTRHVLNGVFIGRETDPTTKEAYPANEPHHVIVGTDGRHLFRANSFHWPSLNQPIVLPASPLLRSTVLAAHPWALAVQTASSRRFEPTAKDTQEWEEARQEYERHVADDPDLEAPSKPQAWEESGPLLFRLVAGPWDLVGKGVEGNYPNYQQVIPASHAMEVSMPAVTADRIVSSLPRLPITDKMRSVHLSITPASGMTFTVGGNALPVPSVKANGSLKIAFNRDYIIKALRLGLSTIRFGDPMDPAVFTAPGRTMVVMPIRLA